MAVLATTFPVAIAHTVVVVVAAAEAATVVVMMAVVGAAVAAIVQLSVATISPTIAVAADVTLSNTPDATHYAIAKIDRTNGFNTQLRSVGQAP